MRSISIFCNNSVLVFWSSRIVFDARLINAYSLFFHWRLGRYGKYLGLSRISRLNQYLGIVLLTSTIIKFEVFRFRIDFCRGQCPYQVIVIQSIFQQGFAGIHRSECLDRQQVVYALL